MNGTRGFSLVELMVVVAVMALLGLLSAPMTQGWSDSAQLRQAEGRIDQGLGMARALALRNRYGIVDGQPVALLCLSSANLLTVHAAEDEDTPATCDSTSSWQSQVPSRVSVLHDGSDFSCLGFDSHGDFASNSLPSGCSSDSSLLLSVGSENVSRTFN